MKRIQRILLLLLASSSQWHTASAQWTQATGLFHSASTSLYSHGSTLFLGCAEGIFRSTDDGARWRTTHSGLGPLYVASFVSRDGVSYAGSGGSGLLRSTDDGRTWGRTGLAFGVVTALAVADSTVIAGVMGYGVYLSTGANTSWIHIERSTDNWVYSLAVIGRNIYAGTRHGVYRTMVTDTSWTSVSNGLPTVYIYSLLARDSSLFAGTDDGRIYLSTDGGASWMLRSEGLPTGTQINALASLGSTLFAAISLGGVYRSTDNGVSWSVAPLGLTTEDITALAVKDDHVFAGTTDGVFRSDNGGDSWKPVNNGLPENSVVASIGVLDSTVFAGTTGGVSVSRDRGESWSPANVGLTNTDIFSLLVSGKDVYVAESFRGIFRSSTGGATWVPSSNGLPDKVFVRALAGHTQASSDTSLYAGTYWKGVFHSTNSGNSWTVLDNGMTTLAINVLAFYGNTLLAGTQVNGVYLSTDGGMGWATATIGMPSDTYVHAFAIVDTTIFAATSRWVFRSTDGGHSWHEAGAGLAHPSVTSIAAYGTHLFAGLENVGVYMSSNMGQSWDAFSTGLPLGTSISTLAVVDSFLLAGSLAGGLWRRPLRDMIIPDAPALDFPDYGIELTGSYFWYIWHPFTSATGYHLQSTNDSSFTGGFFLNDSTITDTMRTSLRQDSTLVPPPGGRYYWRVRAKTPAGWSDWSTAWTFILSTCDVAQAGSLPHECRLEQNYPNPFNPSTTIRYALPHPSHVRLTVFNMLGQKVTTLVSGEVEAGYHKVQFNASGLASGVYFYRLQSGAFVQTKSLCVVK